ncbi:MAG: hypothetical protein OXP36_08420 [Gammaproteobacteria bacterium]|nr:hypothetical protein [Gammaproteobacteria bacterium]
MIRRGSRYLLPVWLALLMESIVGLDTTWVWAVLLFANIALVVPWEVVIPKGVAWILGGWIATTQDDTEDGSPDRERNELTRRFDDNPGNGRVAAKLIAVSTLEEAERVLDTFNLAGEPIVMRYGPVCAYAELLLRNGDPLGATEAINTVTMDVGFYGRGAEFDAAFEEFFVARGGCPGALGPQGS